VEIFKQKEKIVRFSSIKEEDILASLYQILRNIEFHNENLISISNWKKSYELCKNVDLKDMPFVALTLEIDGLFWTGDRQLKKELTNKGFEKFFLIQSLLISQHQFHSVL
jgi:predicted nucleic acid-binding protein